MSQLISIVLQAWKIDLYAVRDDINIAGSPERCEERFVVEDKDHRLFILERIASGAVARRRQIAIILDSLNKGGLAQALSYIPSQNDPLSPYVVCKQGAFWQLSSYISGISLNRPQYVFDHWRGREMSDFLIALRRRSFPFNTKKEDHLPMMGPHIIKSGNTCFNENSLFSIVAYINDLSETITRREPGLICRIEPVLEFLGREFMQIHDTLPVALCHGDFHPLNIIWSENGINAVIDWEFMGYKPEIYDLANLLGCLGIEDPRSLDHDLVEALITGLKSADIFSCESWYYLVEFMIAMRFAWLSEWLRKNDREMIDLEMDYLYLLMDNASDLKQLYS
ncbi:conserved hypothetical protein [Desulfamplus magnetovallimortis]|uniref:Aminoglycoside phosphotransferase domain-containing protein n=1 Tax=Desulfamplus magnetovallimortis TaxID=1246637 RepID=A0A1W1H831_9BACT|nr:phosphotransferase [Desulfamplus magnetovallimortis]SLM28637.1 conserved hypothetical protein [Desulfamplus magnetovallimortis]